MNLDTKPRRRSDRVAQVIAIGELIVALSSHEIYLMPIRNFDVAGFGQPASLIFAVLCIAFLVLPMIALYGVWQGRAIGYVAMGLFPIVAGFAMGVTAVPLVKHLYAMAPQFSSVFVLVVNFGVVLLTIMLYRQRKLRRK